MTVVLGGSSEECNRKDKDRKTMLKNVASVLQYEIHLLKLVDSYHSLSFLPPVLSYKNFPASHDSCEGSSKR